MHYQLQAASQELSRYIKCFWMIDSNDDTSIHREKIVPDGYPEMMFDYGSPYRANITGEWYTQGTDLIAGQIRNHFYLENTAEVGMLAIKFQPWALRLLFGLDMPSLVDRVLEVDDELGKSLSEVKSICIAKNSFEDKVEQLEYWFSHYLESKDYPISNTERSVKDLIESNGSLSLKELRDRYSISERSMERYFKEYIGVSPKFYSRILRFSHIFKLLQEDQDPDWVDISLQAGYYDQSHFIKNFKEFTGDNPSDYPFFEKNMANFFLHEHKN